MVQWSFAFFMFAFALGNPSFAWQPPPNGQMPDVVWLTEAPVTKPSGHKAAVNGHHAAQDSGMMVQYMMMKGLMDTQQRDQVRNSLENLNQKIGALKQEAAAGNITQADYQNAKQQMEQAYTSQLKTKASQNFEPTPPQARRKSRQEGLSPSNQSNSSFSDKENFSNQSASQKSDLAKLESISLGLSNQSGGALPNSASVSGAAVGANPGPSLQSFGSPATGGAALAGMNPAIQNSIHVEASSDNHTVSQNLKRSDSNLGLGSGQSSGSQNLDEPLSEKGEPSDTEAIGLTSLNKEKRAGSHSLVSSETGSLGLINTLKELVGPLKVQKDIFSTKVISDEGIHPLVFLLVLGMVFLMGHQRGSSRIPKAFSQSKGITLRKLG